MTNWTGFTTRELGILLECQEHPDGSTAAMIEGILTSRRIREWEATL